MFTRVDLLQRRRTRCSMAGALVKPVFRTIKVILVYRAPSAVCTNSLKRGDKLTGKKFIPSADRSYLLICVLRPTLTIEVHVISKTIATHVAAHAPSKKRHTCIGKKVECYQILGYNGDLRTSSGLG